MGEVIEVEVAGTNAERLFFAPAGRALRGRIDFAMLKGKTAQAMRETWPNPIPGKVICVNPDTGERSIREPLYDKEYLAVKQLITAQGFELPAEEREVFHAGDVVTWLYWLRRAVDSGLARILKGQLPERSTFPGEVVAKKSDGRPQKDFLFAQTERPADKTAEAMNRMAEVVEQNNKLLAAILQALPKAK